MKIYHIFRSGLLVLLLSIFLGACATAEVSSDQGSQDTPAIAPPNPDPFESFNRDVHHFNMDFDRWIGRPVASAYAKYIPKPIRRSVTSFFNNLWEPNTMINSALQGKFADAAESGGRFILNSTVGLLGIFDVATPLGIPQKEEDFGQTLAVWGVGDGPYLVLPFLGPANLRDTTGIVAQLYTTDLVPILWHGSEAWAAAGVRLIDARASVLGLDEALKFQVDPYLFLRESYRQSRLVQINDGVIPAGQGVDPFEDELFGDELFSE